MLSVIMAWPAIFSYAETGQFDSPAGGNDIADIQLNEGLHRVSAWEGVPQRRWAGPGFWCNRLQDWEVNGGFLRSDASADAHCRTAHLVTRELVNKRSPFHLQVNLKTENGSGEGSFAGFLIGAGEGKLDHRGAALVHHYPGKGGGILAVISTDGKGKPGFRDMSAETYSARYPELKSEDLKESPGRDPSSEVILSLDANPAGKGTYTLRFAVWDAGTKELLAVTELKGVGEQRLLGTVALVSHQAGTKMNHNFRHFSVGGERLAYFPERAYGPIAGTLYSVSDNTLKLSAQFMHMGYETYLPGLEETGNAGNTSGRMPRMRLLAHLEQKTEEGTWSEIAGPEVVAGPTYQVVFRVQDWNSSKESDVRVVFRDWNGEVSYYPTRITADPVDKPEVSIAGFTGMGAIGRSPHYAGRPAAEGEVLIGRWTPANVWSPFNHEVEAIGKQGVDILFFTGDQVYENKPTPKDWSISPFEDYLYKWLVWVWSFRDLTNHLPAIVQPDDHDIYQGNFWGWGGRANLTGYNRDGGYLRSPAFINMVHKTMSGHLPDPWEPVPACQGISNYYTKFTWGGIGFAVMEDRKFKTPPQVEDPEQQVLLGQGQMAMLEEWGKEWTGQQFKCMVSQTIYASMSVNFDGTINDDSDSNGFPKNRRDELIDLLRRSGVFILSGDQHLGTFARLGVEQPSDGVYQFAVPAMGNYFWRWFYPETAGMDREPGAPDYTGEFQDGFGNLFRMIAVANPERRSLLDQHLRQRFVLPADELENGMVDQRRPCLGDGYGIVRFNKTDRKVKVECWPYNAEPGNDAFQFAGWPVTLEGDALDGRTPVAWLPELEISAPENPVVQVIRVETGEVVSTRRITPGTYSPGVFDRNGSYRVRVGLPGSGKAGGNQVRWSLSTGRGRNRSRSDFKYKKTESMKKVSQAFRLILLAVVFVITSCNPPDAQMATRDFMPLWDSVSPLENPGKGWYQHLIDINLESYAVTDDSLFATFPGMDHLYLRLAWSLLEPREGEFDWHLIDEVVEKYVPLGYGISFRIISKEHRVHDGVPDQVVDGVIYGTPYWVRKAGAHGTDVKARNGLKAWSPDWSDPVYLEKLDQFHRAFAARYDDKPWVRYVDVGSIGDYGEGHTNASTKIPPTVEDVKASMDVYLKNYKHTQIVATDALLFWNKEDQEVKELYDYAVSHGITLRDDSPMVAWHLQKYRDHWSISHPHFYDPLYLEKPVILELEHYAGVKRNGYWLGKNGCDTVPELGAPGAEFFRRSLEIMHATYIGHHGFAEDFLTDNPDLAVELLNRCGYWYFPVSASYPTRLGRGEQELTFTWLNRGVAPSYRNFSMVLYLDNGNGGCQHRIIIGESGNRSWLPGKTIQSNYTFSLPGNIEEGTYQLKFKLKDTESGPQRDVFLALESSALDRDHYISLGEVTVSH